MSSNAAAPRCLPIFAAPFATASFREPTALNDALLVDLLGAGEPDGRNLGGSSSPAVFESPPDFWHRPPAHVAQLRSFVLESAGRVVADLSGFSAAESATLRVQARAWFSIVPPEAGIAARQHPMASWCAIYCVQAADAPPERLDSGALRLYDPRLGNVYLDAGNARLRMPYGHGHFGARQVAGQLVLFPATLLYEIAPVRGERPLVMVTALLRFELGAAEA